MNLKNKIGEYIKTDCAVIGSGGAGCTVALELADKGKNVHLFTKCSSFGDSNSYLVAGGLAAVDLENKNDSFELHISDTVKAGGGLNDIKTVKYCIEHFFKDVIEWLVNKGVQFDLSEEGYKYDLHKEGGHSINRVFHKSDQTGVDMMETLGRLVEKHPDIVIHKEHMAIDLITQNKLDGVRKNKDACLGCYVYDIKNNMVKTVAANGVFIATGGLGKVFLYTSNTDIATGDGFAMGYRSGLPLANMGFIQFHPTVFYSPDTVDEVVRRKELFTEALRGAGAVLKLHKDDHHDFVQELGYDPRLGSNSSRDIVTRAEDAEMRKNGLSHVWLDCTKINIEKLKKEFSRSYNFCIEKGIDSATESIPVVYAVHYSNGGILVGNYGETIYKDGTGMLNCYVLGETACTGLHGATRLASNSMNEGILFARSAAKHFIQKNVDNLKNIEIPLWDTKGATEPRDRALLDYYWETIRRTMTQLCGISRNSSRLKDAKAVLDTLRTQINRYYWNYYIDKDSLEVRNILEVANVIIDSALFRKETRACHFREDYPEVRDEYKGWDILQIGSEPYIIRLKD